MVGKHRDIDPETQSFRFKLDRFKLGLTDDEDTRHLYTWDHTTGLVHWESNGKAESVGYHPASVRSSLRRGVWVPSEVL